MTPSMNVSATPTITLLLPHNYDITAQNTSSLVPNLAYVDLDIETNGYRNYIGISNWSSFSDELFSPAPDLPPCGQNTNSSRTWLKIFDNEGNYIYGYCAFESARSLENFWFFVPSGNCPPEGVFVLLVDRLADTYYISNLLDTRDWACAP